MLPFTHQQFVNVFALYNGVIWPLQWLAQAVGLAMLAGLRWPSPARDRSTVLALAVMWLWTGIVYHGVFFSLVNPASTLFAAFFVAEGLLLFEAAWRGRLAFGQRGWRRGLGVSLLVYAVVLYPSLGLLLGERVLDLPAFGLTPCPVALATLGVLLLASGAAPRWLAAIPLAWALIGGSAAILLKVPQDWPLLVTPALLAILAVHERMQRRNASSPADRAAPA